MYWDFIAIIYSMKLWRRRNPTRTYYVLSNFVGILGDYRFAGEI